MNIKYYTKKGELTKYSLSLGCIEVTKTVEGDMVVLRRLPNTSTVYEVYNSCTGDNIMYGSLVEARNQYRSECKSLGIKPMFGEGCF